ncbi:dihydroorotase [soil metagenome]
MTPASFGHLTDAPASLLLTGVRVIDPSDGTDAIRDLAIHEGRFVADPPAHVKRIDGRGLVATPGFCDLHVHLRDPGDSAIETIETGARAAAKGGFTTICAMPNTDPPLDHPELVAAALGQAIDAACRVRVIGAATIARAGEAMSDVASMVEAGVIGFSDDGSAIPTDDLTRFILSALSNLDVPLIEHAEDARLAGAGVMRAGPIASRLGLAGWPPEAESSVVERDIALSEKTGARLHLTHLSTAASVEAVRNAKARGVNVTCDVTPHHLAMTDAWVAGSRRFSWEDAEAGDTRLAYDGACRVNPPLASRDDALALLAGLADGIIDAIATDHAPHPPERKLVPFEGAAPGLIGLETALSLGLAAVEAAALDLSTLIAALSTRPAAIIGESRSLAIGAPANLVAFDPTAAWRVERAALASVSSNTPLLGRELPGVVRLTIADGRLTYRS